MVALYVDPDALHGHALTFAGHADRMVQISEGLRLTLESMGPVWGEDTYGEQFSQQYLPGCRDLVSGTGDLALGVGSVALGIHQMSKIYRSAEIATGL